MKQGEIWLISLDPVVGAEMRKTRPAIIVNDDALGKLPLRVIVPLTDWKEKYNQAVWMIRVPPDKHNGLTKDSCADCFQVLSLSNIRFVHKIGNISKLVLDEIKTGLSEVFSIV